MNPTIFIPIVIAAIAAVISIFVGWRQSDATRVAHNSSDSLMGLS